MSMSGTSSFLFSLSSICTQILIVDACCLIEKFHLMAGFGAFIQLGQGFFNLFNLHWP